MAKIIAVLSIITDGQKEYKEERKPRGTYHKM